MIDEEMQNLLRTSYSNNSILFDVEEKMHENAGTIKDIEALIYMRNAKTVWTNTAINMVVTSGLLSGVSKLVFDLQNREMCAIFAGLVAVCVTSCYLGYKEEKEQQQRLRDYALLNSNVSEDKNYNKEQLQILKKEQKILREIQKNIVASEKEINNCLVKKTKKLIKK